MKLSLSEARKLFEEMMYETRAYLPDYEKYLQSRK